MHAVRQALAELVPNWSWQDISQVTYLSGGYSNSNYALCYQTERYVLRLPGMPQPFADRQLEQNWYARLPQGVSAELVALNPRSGVLLTRWVDGTLLAELTEPMAAADLVHYVQQLHRQMPDIQRHYDVGVLEQALQSQAPDAAPLTPPASLPPDTAITTCHNDLNPWNIIITPAGHWVTLDWEFVGRNDPLFDWVSLHQGLQLPDDELLELSAAFGHANLTARLHHNLQAFWRRELAWAQLQFNGGNTRDEVRLQIQTAQSRLQQLPAVS